MAGTLIAGAAVAVLQSAAHASHGPIAIGIKYDQPGLGLMGDNGKPSGFDVDVATYVARSLGYSPDQINWVDAPSSERETMIRDGKADFVVATYSMTPLREKLVTFAGPYFVAGQDLLVRKTETSITGPSSLDGRTVCAAAGSTSGPSITAFSPRSHVLIAPTYSQCLLDLLAGHVDAVTADDVILAGYAAEHPGQLRVVGHPFTKERYAVGLKKGNTTLQSKITAAITDMISSGTWQRDVNATIGKAGYKTLPPPPVFNAPDGEHVTHGTRFAPPDLVTVADELISKSNDRQWAALDALTCPSVQHSVHDLVSEFSPQYDTNLPAAVTKGIGFHDTLTGVSIDRPGIGAVTSTGKVFAQETFTHVPPRYKGYFKDIAYTGTMKLTDGTWKLCGLAANFAGG
jgi:glutamate transport system substrate-binding protein